MAFKVFRQLILEFYLKKQSGLWPKLNVVELFHPRTKILKKGKSFTDICQEKSTFNRSKWYILYLSKLQSPARTVASLLAGIGITGAGTLGGNGFIFSNLVATFGLDLNPSLCSSNTSTGEVAL